MEIINNQEKQSVKKQAEIYYDTAEMTKLKYVKVIYTDPNGKLFVVRTNVKFMGDILISLFFKSNGNFDINYPQDVMVKFVTNDAMYVAKTLLHEVKKSGDTVYLSVVPPKKMIKQQNRKYSRVDLMRNCVLVVSDEDGKSTTYMSKTVNMSASGILIHELETVFSDEFVAIQPSKYDCYHILLFLEQDIALKLFARYVRYENENGSHRYAFQFLNLKPDDIEFLSQYVTREQLTQLNAL